LDFSTVENTLCIRFNIIRPRRGVLNAWSSLRNRNGVVRNRCWRVDNLYKYKLYLRFNEMSFIYPLKQDLIHILIPTSPFHDLYVYLLITRSQKESKRKMGSIAPPPRETAATKLRNLIATPGPVILAPGVYDGFSARIALSVGFDTIYMVRASTSFHKSSFRVVVVDAC
jgi:hypothetical protein